MSNLDNRELEAHAIFRYLDREPSDKITRFMRAISILYLQDPHMKVLRLAAVVQKHMPQTIASYNGFREESERDALLNNG